MGLNLGVFGFSHNQNNRGSSGVYVPRHAKLVNKFVLRVFFACGRQKLEDLEIEPMADDAITPGGIGLGSLVYIYLWLHPNS